MFVQLILLSFLFHYGLTIRNNSSGVCQKVNICRKKDQLCYPVVTNCRNSSCHFRRFYTIENRNRFWTNWFYDTNYERCRRSTNHIENFVYFRFLRDCKRFCPIRRQKRDEEIVTLHVSESPLEQNETVYVELKVDSSPAWMSQLADRMNISTDVYQAQVNYFQNYRRHFAHFMDPSYQLMRDHQHYNAKKSS